MERSEQALRRVRRAYEFAHAGAAVRALGVAGVLIAFAFLLHRSSNALWFVGATLAISLGVLAWRGGAWRRGAFAGVLAGLPPLLAPAIVFALSREHCSACTEMPLWTCAVACFGVGSAVGMLVGYRAIRDAFPSKFALGALATATLTGLLGCGATGLGGAAGVVIGVVAGGLTGWVVAVRVHST